jgi:hypothetical protein
MPDWAGFDPVKILKGALIGGGVGLVLGGGLTVAKTLKQKQVPASRDLSVQTLNLDRAAPALIPTLLSLEEMVQAAAEENKADWRQHCGSIIRNCDSLFNVLVRVAKKEITIELKYVAEVEIWAREVCKSLDKLAVLLPVSAVTEGEDSLQTQFKAVSKEIQDTVQAAWLNFKNSS